MDTRHRDEEDQLVHSSGSVNVYLQRKMKYQQMSND